MAKIITDKELAKIVKRIIDGKLITGERGDSYKDFLKDLAVVVTDFMGGEIGTIDKEQDRLCQEIVYYIAIHHDEYVPEDGGIWKNYDKECSIEEWNE